MADLIDRQALMDRLDADLSIKDLEHDWWGQGVLWVIDRIRKMPAVEPERKHGTWIGETLGCINGGTTHVWQCSECGSVELQNRNFCPECGADHEGGTDMSQTCERAVDTSVQPERKYDEVASLREFAKFVADEVLSLDADNCGFFSEVACRKLEKLGYIKRVGGFYVRTEEEQT